MGRLPYKPTDEQRRTVETMIAAAIREDKIAACLGIDGKTLRKHFRDQIEKGVTKANTNVAARLYQIATTGEGRHAVTAAIFWLKCRAGWKETSALEVSGPNAGPITIDPVQALEDQLSGIAERERSAADSPAAGT